MIPLVIGGAIVVGYWFYADPANAPAPGDPIYPPDEAGRIVNALEFGAAAGTTGAIGKCYKAGRTIRRARALERAREKAWRDNAAFNEFADPFRGTTRDGRFPKPDEYLPKPKPPKNGYDGWLGPGDQFHP